MLTAVNARFDSPRRKQLDKKLSNVALDMQRMHKMGIYDPCRQINHSALHCFARRRVVLERCLPGRIGVTWSSRGSVFRAATEGRITYLIRRDLIDWKKRRSRPGDRQVTNGVGILIP